MFSNYVKCVWTEMKIVKHDLIYVVELQFHTPVHRVTIVS